MNTEKEITEVKIGCAIKVHKSLGSGLLESAYEECPQRRMSWKKPTLLSNQRGIKNIEEEIF